MLKMLMEEWKFSTKSNHSTRWKRINQPTDLGNAIAILRGTDPNDKKNFYDWRTS